MNKYTVLAVLTLCLVALNAAPTQAQTTNGNIIYACYHKNTGAVRRMSGPGQCRNPEIQISWNVAGVPGPQGVRGQQGPRGEKGEQGPPGGFNGMREFTQETSHEFVVPAGVTHLMLELWGAGGGGGGGALENIPEGGAGGGSGAYTRTVIQVTPGATYQMVIGAGGAGGAAAQHVPAPTNIVNPESGNDGGITFFADSEGNVLASAPGGQGGSRSRIVNYRGCDSGGTGAEGGAGGLASNLGEAIRRSGLDGSPSIDAIRFVDGQGCQTTPGTAGAGAPAPFPAPGLLAGKGGSGGYSGTNGEPGSHGYAIITW